VIYVAQRRARRSSAVANDERILDAAMEMAAEVGLDALTMSGVARLSGFTSGAMYSRYEYREELLADMWERRCFPALKELIERAATYRREPITPERRADFIASSWTPTAAVTLGVEMCLIAHRVPELNEIIPQAVLECLDDVGLVAHGGPLSAERSVDLVMVAGVLGYVVLHPFAQELVGDVERAVRVTEESAIEQVGPPPPPMAASQRLAFERDDSIRNDLLEAAQVVVARSGVKRATLSRIGRVARLASATVYGHYADRNELIADILRIAQVSNNDTDTRLDSFGDPLAMAAAMSGWLQPDAMVRRRLNQETLIAAWHDPAIATVFVEEERRSMQRVADTFPEGLIDSSTVLLFQRLSLLSVNGTAILVEVMPSLADFDWRPVIDLMIRSVFSEA
jgi:AcrR family transcriptional regulator